MGRSVDLAGVRGFREEHADYMKIAIPDLVSNSYFPVVAAVELGCFQDEGLHATLDLVFPVDAAYRALADGQVDLVGGAAHAVLAAFPRWRGVKLLAAQSQGMYWFLVMRPELGIRRGDLSLLPGKRIAAASWVDLGLKQLLAEAGVDPGAVDVVPVPVRRREATPNFGLLAAQALAEGLVDGFWANGMAAELAVRAGAGTVILDARRGDGPPGGFDYTFAALAATDRFIAADKGRASAVVRALARSHALLVGDPALATKVGEHLFPSEPASLIEDLVRRDSPFYSTAIPKRAIDGMANFARARGLLDGTLVYDDVVAIDLLAG